MGYQDDYVMRTISDLVRAIARLALGKNEINYALPDTEDKYSDTDRIYRKLRDLVDAGEINEAENQLYENLDENDTEHLEMALTFYMYLNQLDDDTLFMANYSREEIVEGINSVSASFGITGFEKFCRYHSWFDQIMARITKIRALTGETTRNTGAAAG